MKTIQLTERDYLGEVLQQNRYATRFLLPPGRWLLDDHLSWKEFDYCMLGPGCELIGASSGTTFIESQNVEDPVAQIECLTAGGRSDCCDFVRIEGLTVLANFQPDEFGIVGVHIWSDRAVVRDVKVTGIAGKRQAPDAPSREGFGILLNQSGAILRVGGSVVEDVRVALRDSGQDENYVCGIMVGYKTPTFPSSIRNASVQNLAAHPAHAAFGINGRVIASGLSNPGRFNRAVFCDVTGGSDSLITGSTLNAERVVMELRASKGEVWRNIVLRDSNLRLEPVNSLGNYGAVLVLAEDVAPGAFQNVQVANCLVDYGQSQVPIYAGSMVAKSGYGCGLRGCSRPPTLISASTPAGAFTVS